MTNQLIPRLRFKQFNDPLSKEYLNNLSSFSRGKGYSKNSLISNGKPIILYGRMYTNYQTKINNINDTFVRGSSKDKLSKKGDIIIPSSGETPIDIARASVINKSGIILGGDLNIIQPIHKIDSYFLALCITYGKRKLKLARLSQGRSIVHIHNNDLKSLLILYPTLSEQKHIGTFFAKLDRMIELQSKKITHLKQLKKGYLQKMFPQKGKNVPRLRFNKFHDVWNIKKLEKIINMFDNKRIPVTSNKRKKGNIGYYGANGIMDYVNGFTHIGHYVLLAEDGAKSIKNYPIHNVTGKIWVNNHAHVIKGKKDICNTDFLSYLLSEINLYPYLVGNGRYKLNANIMKKISLKVPSIQEQNQIGQFFKHLDQSITKQKNKLNQLKKLKKAYLQKMFI